MTSPLPDPEDAPRPWLEAYPPGVPPHYDYPAVPVTRLLDDAAQDFPDTVAVASHGYQLTYAELLDRTDRFATALQDLHIAPGDRVSLLLPACPQHLIALFAVLRLGAVVVEHDLDMSAATLERQLNAAGSRAVVCLDPVYSLLGSMKGRLRTVRHIIATGLQDALPFPRNVLFPLLGRRRGAYRRIDEAEGVLRFTELIHRAPPFASQVPLEPRSQTAVVTYARQPTAPLAFTHAALVTAAFQTRLWIPDVQNAGERLLAGLPLHTVFGLACQLLVAVLSAGTLVLVREPSRGRLLRAVDRTDATLMMAPAATFVAPRERSRQRRDLSSLRVCLAVGSRLEPAAAERFEHGSGARVRLGWGVPAAGGLTHVNPVYGRADAERIGLPLPDVACVLLDPDGSNRPAPGARGLLAVSGPQRSRDGMDASGRANGWVHTGALAEYAPAGFRLVDERAQPPLG